MTLPSDDIPPFSESGEEGDVCLDVELDPTVTLGVGGPLSKSSLYANRSSSGTRSSGALFSPSACCWAFHSSSRSLKISSLLRPPHPAHLHARLSPASATLADSLISNPPTWPFASPLMNALIAHSAVRIPHAGCHVSSWCPLMDRHISRFTSKRPLGVRKRKDGGRSGYVAGRMMRPW
jgi:hypothetical protein